MREHRDRVPLPFRLAERCPLVLELSVACLTCRRTSHRPMVVSWLGLCFTSVQILYEVWFPPPPTRFYAERRSSGRQSLFFTLKEGGWAYWIDQVHICSSLESSSSSAVGAGEQRKGSASVRRTGGSFTGEVVWLGSRALIVELVPAFLRIAWLTSGIMSKRLKQSGALPPQVKGDYIMESCHSGAVAALVTNAASYRGDCCFGGTNLECLGFAKRGDGDSQKTVGRQGYHC